MILRWVNIFLWPIPQKWWLENYFPFQKWSLFRGHSPSFLRDADWLVEEETETSTSQGLRKHRNQWELAKWMGGDLVETTRNQWIDGDLVDHGRQVTGEYRPPSCPWGQYPPGRAAISLGGGSWGTWEYGICSNSFHNNKQEERCYDIQISISYH